MESWDDEQRVRPIEITDDDVAAPEPDDSHGSGDGPQRPWLPLAVTIAAVTVLVTAVSIFGAVQFEDPPSRDSFSATTIPGQEATTTTALRSLNDVIPGWRGSLTIATAYEEYQLWSMRWEPTFKVPSEEAIITPWGAEFVGAAFSASGQHIAAFGVRSGASGEVDTLISPPEALTVVIDLPRVQDAAWHADRDDTIAWVTNPKAPPPQELRVSTLDTIDVPLQGEVITNLPEGGDIVRWDDAGFVLNILDEIVVLDPDGAEILRKDGFAVSSTSKTVVAVLTTGEGPQWHFLDRFAGNTLSLKDFGVDAPTALTSLIASADGELFAAAAYRIDKSATEDTDDPVINRTAITIISDDLSAPRIIQVDRHAVPIQFARDTPFLVLKDARTNDLIFVDWLSGATHVFDVPRDHEILAVHLAPPSED